MGNDTVRRLETRVRILRTKLEEAERWLAQAQAQVDTARKALDETMRNLVDAQKRYGSEAPK